MVQKQIPVVFRYPLIVAAVTHYLVYRYRSIPFFLRSCWSTQSRPLLPAVLRYRTSRKNRTTVHIAVVHFRPDLYMIVSVPSNSKRRFPPFSASARPQYHSTLWSPGVPCNGNVPRRRRVKHKVGSSRCMILNKAQGGFNSSFSRWGWLWRCFMCLPLLSALTRPQNDTKLGIIDVVVRRAERTT